MEHYVLLSTNTGLKINEIGLEFTKVTNSCNLTHSSIQINFIEWFEIFKLIPELHSKIDNFAHSIFNQILRGSQHNTDDLRNYEKIISDKVAVAVSVFKPKTRHFISISIRSYFYNRDGNLRFKKFPGITLSQEEFNSLREQMDQVNTVISTMSSVHKHDDNDDDGANGNSSCSLCSSVQTYLLEEEEEEDMNSLNLSRCEVSMDLHSPNDFNAIFRRIYNFAEKGVNAHTLTINLKKMYEPCSSRKRAGNDDTHSTSKRPCPPQSLDFTGSSIPAAAPNGALPVLNNANAAPNAAVPNAAVPNAVAAPNAAAALNAAMPNSAAVPRGNPFNSPPRPSAASEFLNVSFSNSTFQKVLQENLTKFYSHSQYCKSHGSKCQDINCGVSTSEIDSPQSPSSTFLYPLSSTPLKFEIDE